MGLCRDLSESGIKKVAFLGDTDLAEIVYLGIQEWELELNNIYVQTIDKPKFMNIPVSDISEIVNDSNEVIIVCLYDKTHPMSKSYLPEGIDNNDKFRWIF